jgi:hypothetical protein
MRSFGVAGAYLLRTSGALAGHLNAHARATLRRSSCDDELTLRSRNHLDQNYKLSLHRFIFDGGVGAQQSEARNAVDEEQAVDLWFLSVTIVEKRHVDAEHLSNLLEKRRADPVDALFRIFPSAERRGRVYGRAVFERYLFPGDVDGFVAPSRCPRPRQIVG